MASIGSIFVDFIARTAQLEAGTDEAVGIVKDGASQMGGAFSGVGGASDSMSASIASGIARSMPAMIAMRMAARDVVNEIIDVYKNIDDIPGVSPDVIASIHQMKFELEGSNSFLKQAIAQGESWFAEAAIGIGLAAGGLVYGMDNAHDAAQKLSKDAEDFDNKGFTKAFQAESAEMDRLNETTGEYANSLEKLAAAKYAAAGTAGTKGEADADNLEGLKDEVEAKKELASLDEKLVAAGNALSKAEDKLNDVGRDHVATVSELKERQRDILDQMAELGQRNEKDGVQTERLTQLKKGLAQTDVELAAAIAKLKEPMQMVEDTFVKGFQGISNEVAQFVVTGKANFKQFFDQLEEQIVSTIIKLALINPILNAMFSGTSGYQTQAAFSGGTAIVGAIAGFLADGGDADQGAPYVVGEEGPELFVPRTNGTVVPNGAMANRSGGGGGDMHIHYNIESGVTRNDLVPILARHSQQIKSDISGSIKRGGSPARAMGR